MNIYSCISSDSSINFNLTVTGDVLYTLEQFSAHLYQSRSCIWDCQIYIANSSLTELSEESNKMSSSRLVALSCLIVLLLSMFLSPSSASANCINGCMRSSGCNRNQSSPTCVACFLRCSTANQSGRKRSALYSLLKRSTGGLDLEDLQEYWWRSTIHTFDACQEIYLPMKDPGSRDHNSKSGLHRSEWLPPETWKWYLIGWCDFRTGISQYTHIDIMFNMIYVITHISYQYRYKYHQYRYNYLF